MKAFRDSRAATEELFDPMRDKCIRLYILGTRPGYRKKGYATTLCQWGMKMASDKRLGVQVLSSQMGKSLYTRLGFTTLNEIVRQDRGEESRDISYAMAFIPKFA